jgi:serine/threonine-protein kinase
VSGRRIDFKEGDRFLYGEYQLELKLGEGGMGQVWAAIELYSGNFVAIKLMHAQSGNFVARFRQECRFYTKLLRHPNIVGMLKAGEDENGVMYIIMELLRGKTLRKVLHSAQLDVEHALHLAVQIADPVAHMHKKGVWHRDLKPENMIVGTQESDKGHLWIVDFGIARFANAKDLSFDSEAMTDVGTVWYMAPEQVEPSNRKNVDNRADVYAFGAILYEMIAKRHIFVPKGEIVTPPQVMYGHLHATIKPLPEIVAGCSDDLWELVRWCLARDPRDRLGSLDKAANAIRGMIRPSQLPSNPYLVQHVRNDILHAARAAAFDGFQMDAEPNEAGALSAGELDEHQRTTLPGPYPDAALEAAIQRAKDRATAAKAKATLPTPEPEPAEDPEDEAEDTVENLPGIARQTQPVAEAFAPPVQVLPFEEPPAPPKLGKGHTTQMPSAATPLAQGTRAALVPFGVVPASAPPAEPEPVSPYATTEPQAVPETAAASRYGGVRSARALSSAATILAARGSSLEDARASALARTPSGFSPFTPVATMTMQPPVVPPTPTYPGVPSRPSPRPSPRRTYERAVGAGVLLAVLIVGALFVARRWTAIAPIDPATTAQPASPAAEPGPSALPAAVSATAQEIAAPVVNATASAPPTVTSATAMVAAQPAATANSPPRAPPVARPQAAKPPPPKPQEKRPMFELLE